MNFFRRNLRLLATLELLPWLESGEETLVGGQAVLEGVMRRSPHAGGIAVRKASGEMMVHSEGLERPSEKHKWMGWPIVRGVTTLGQAMTLGFKALQFSANAALEEEQKETPKEEQLKFSGWLAAVNIAISLGFFIAMYKFLPWLATTQLKHNYPAMDTRFGAGLVAGRLRI